VSAERPADIAALVLYFLGIAGGIAAIIHWPFLFTPIGLLLVLIGIVASPANRQIARAAVVVLVLGFMIGASIAVWNSNPLY
jgi:hypothetical protein